MITSIWDWHSVASDCTTVQPLQPLFVAGTTDHFISRTESISATEGAVPRHLVNKIDSFSALALRAVTPLARNLPVDISRTRVGVFVGNILGGWTYGEPQLENLIAYGPDAVHPFQATAWFPAAAQGEITIRFGFQGTSKTVSGGWLCGLEALMLAADALETGAIDLAIAGAAESWLSPLPLWAMMAACVEQRVIGEGAAFLVLKRGGSESPTICIEPGPFQPGRASCNCSCFAEGFDVPLRQVLIPGVDPILDIIAVLQNLEQSARIRLDYRAKTGQSFTVHIVAARQGASHATTIYNS